MSYDRPSFRFVADSAEPDITSGTAIWSYEGRAGIMHEIKFPVQNFTDAHHMNELLLLTYERGAQAGNAQVLYKVQGALGNFKSS